MTKRLKDLQARIDRLYRQRQRMESLIVFKIWGYCLTRNVWPKYNRWLYPEWQYRFGWLWNGMHYRVWRSSGFALGFIALEGPGVELLNVKGIEKLKFKAYLPVRKDKP